ncbi:probable protein arginine N-methyltransferase 6 isoform X4 [Arachis ipaensis]|uniref:probable protein arginine N-methyltransferase 6 isoform X4 n=1 Tax=Arachis ipaensis TaxID=130454 RepID=UPI000A2B0E44|nr:probable protein arginine N-methyltransferase 6 isoform X4 [Arachis ipaensis]
MFPKENSSNGYHNPPPPPPGVGNINSHRERARRGTRRSRASRDSISLRVYDQQQQQQQRAPCTDFDMAYFHSYAHLGIHEEMIKDRVRTETYREAIMRHQSFIAGKVVVDVGCGTGILAIFCAQAGAKRVYAVDASDIALQDVEINEQSMLGSVITARDRWLKPGGLILPSNATLYMAPVTHCDRYSGSIDFWRNVYGIDMSAMLSLAKQCAFEEPSVETITGENILTWPHVVKYIDCYSVTIGELETVTTRFKFNSMMRAPLHGFAFWFDVEFNGPAMPQSNYPSSTSFTDNHLVNGSQRKKRINPNEALVLSTAPEDPPTHWQQTLIYFYDPIELEQDQVIEGLVTLTQSKENARFMNIHLEYTSGGRSHIKESVMR